MSIERKTVYFGEKGPLNTDETLRLAKERADILGIKDIVIASYSGDSGVKASQVFDGSNLVVVGGVVGFKEPNKMRMVPEHRVLIENNGGKVILAGHAFGMIGRAIHQKFGTMQYDEIIAHVLRIFSRGVKVCCEISCMAIDAGLLEAGKEVIAIAGSGRGSDTAIVIKPNNTHRFFDTQILEFICKPRQ